MKEFFPSFFVLSYIFHFDLTVFLRFLSVLLSDSFSHSFMYVIVLNFSSYHETIFWTRKNILFHNKEHIIQILYWPYCTLHVNTSLLSCPKPEAYSFPLHCFFSLSFLNVLMKKLYMSPSYNTNKPKHKKRGHFM